MPEYINDSEGTLSSLNRNQKEAVCLLSIGTFLEYVDFMLYVHMASLLNEVFFAPMEDHLSRALLSAFSFSAPFALRPIGALIFGYIGDSIGRKATVIITTSMMAISCLIVANLQGYNEIGITASIILIICRIMQGMSSIGEVIGVEIYFTETIKPPTSYQITGLVGFFSVLGGTAALGLASLVTFYGFNWRLAFWIGAVIAIVGVTARTALHETPEFANAKKRVATILAEEEEDPAKLAKKSVYQKKVSTITALFLFCIDCTWPLCFYIAYMYCGDILKDTFNYSSEEVINHNFYVSLVEAGSLLVLSYMSRRISPLKILKNLNIIFLILALPCIYLMYKVTTPFELLLLQMIIISFATSRTIGVPIFFRHFPIFKRYTSVGIVHALSRMFIYVVTSFGLVYFNTSYWPVIIAVILASIVFALGVRHFEKLEKKRIEEYSYNNG